MPVLSLDFITTICCHRCRGEAPLVHLRRELALGGTTEIRLFRCRRCERHSVLQLAA